MSKEKGIKRWIFTSEKFLCNIFEVSFVMMPGLESNLVSYSTSLELLPKNQNWYQIRKFSASSIAYWKRNLTSKTSVCINVQMSKKKHIVLNKNVQVSLLLVLVASFVCLLSMWLNFFFSFLKLKRLQLCLCLISKWKPDLLDFGIFFLL